MRIPKHLKFIRTKDKGRTLLANRDIKKGEIILKLKGIMKKCSEASVESVQIDDDKFIDSKYYYPEDYINHSCDPNTKIDFKTMNFVALRNIKKGEEITYNYLTTEYDLVRDNLDFDCKCGSKNCFGRIKGFRFLTKSQKLKLKPLLSPFLKKKIGAPRLTPSLVSLARSRCALGLTPSGRLTQFMRKFAQLANFPNFSPFGRKSSHKPIR